MLYIHRLVVPDSCRWSKTILRQLTIVITALMASLVVFGFTPVYSQTQDSSMNTIKPISISKIDSNSYAYVFEYCPQNVTKNTIGIMIQLGIESIAVAIDENQDVGVCQKYSAKIHQGAQSDINHFLFQKNDVPDLIWKQENKVAYLEYSIISEEQVLRKLQAVSRNDNVKNDKIEEQLDKINYLQSLLKSAKSSVRTLVSLS